MATRYTLTPDQLRAQLNDDIAELKREADAYDAGHFAAAGAMAIRIFTMLHDDPPGGRNPAVSRATRAGAKPERMPSLAVRGLIDFRDAHGPVCTVASNLMGASGFIPLLDLVPVEQAPTLSFEDWWSAAVFRDAIGNELSRRDIVRTMRDKEVAHADGALPAAYGAVIYQGMFGLEQHAPTMQIGDASIFRVIVRQLSHEVIRAFDPDYPYRPTVRHGRLLTPSVLLEVQLARADGYSGRNLMQGEAPVVVQVTADEPLFKDWASGAIPFEPPAGMPEMLDDAPARTSLFMRVLLTNSNRVELNVKSTMITRDARSGAFLLRCFLDVRPMAEGF